METHVVPGPGLLVIPVFTRNLVIILIVVFGLLIQGRCRKCAATNQSEVNSGTNEMRLNAPCLYCCQNGLVSRVVSSAWLRRD